MHFDEEDTSFLKRQKLQKMLGKPLMGGVKTIDICKIHKCRIELKNSGVSKKK